MVQEHDYKNASGGAPTEAQQGIDLAGQSLGKALWLSFLLLTLLIVVLVLFFFGRGAFKIPPDQKVIVLRWGKADETRVREEGLHYAWPSPIDEVVRLSVQDRELIVNTFWPRMTEKGRMEAAEKAERGEDVAKNIFGAKGAYMLTGDLNILEGQWAVVYSVKSDPESLVKYFRKVDLDERYPHNDPRRYAQERKLIKNVLQAAVVREISALPVMNIYPRQSTALPEHVKRTMHSLLSELDCGMEIRQVNLIEIRPPEQVKKAFDAVLEAIQMAEEVRLAAQQSRKETLIGAAGEVGPDLGEAIGDWWKAREKDGTTAMAEQEERIQGLFALAEGEVKSVLLDAETYKERIKEETQSDAESIQDLVDLLEKSPVAVRMSLEVRHVKTMEQVLAGCYEKFLFRPIDGARSTLEIWMNRRPELLRQERAELVNEYRYR